ncbi:MAG: hypothetical protein AAF368_04685 [Planctomycetota bacterium]
MKNHLALLELARAVLEELLEQQSALPAQPDQRAQAVEAVSAVVSEPVHEGLDLGESESRLDVHARERV